MKVSGMLGGDLGVAPLATKRMKSLGYDEAFSAEINNDPCFPLLPGACHGRSIDLSNPTSMAHRDRLAFAQ
jgi:hypothetical protein